MKTLGEIAIEANLITKANAAKAGRMADERKQPLVVVLVRDLHVDEVALIAAIRKQTRVTLIDVATVRVDPEALRVVSKDLCARLRVLPLALSSDSEGKVLRVAMADPTDTTAIAELEHVAGCDIDVAAMPLSAIEELLDRSYKQFTTAITRGKVRKTRSPVVEEASVTAQIPLSALREAAERSAEERDDTELRLTALVEILMAKGLISEEELADAIRRQGV